MKWNKFLERQIRRHLSEELLAGGQLTPFLDAVNDSYHAYERDQELQERAFRLSDEEYSEVNGQLREELEMKQESIAQLKEAISDLGEAGLTLESDHLLDIVGFLKSMIADRKQAEEALKIKEEKYRSIIANMNLGLLEVDNDEIIRYANQTFCNMSGYSLEAMEGKRASDLFTTEKNRDMVETKNQMRQQGISDAYEISYIDPTGRLKWWLISGAPRYNDSGEIEGSIGVHLDITDQKKLEVELNDAREAAEQSARAKESFLANMSHEIRTPMNAILGMSRQLDKTNLGRQQRFFLKTIGTAADHLMVVINDILDISKIEAGKMNLESIGFNPGEVLRHCLRIMQPRADEKGLELSLNIGNGVAPVLLGDPHRLNQVLLNLASNAIKFTEKGSVTMTCKLVDSEKGRQTLSIGVKDTGIGMDAAFLGGLFQKFIQEDLTTARKYGGTGLGMAISKQLVELMDGKIEVSSEKGLGTEVVLIIPFGIGKATDLPETKKPVATELVLKERKILLVEDNEMNRLVVTTMLGGYEAEFTEATNGEEAIRCLEEGTFDLVLMDVQMPVMNGLEATEYIRTVMKLEIPIIALTANAIKGERERCIAAGMDDFVSKPFEEDELVSTMARCLNLSGAVEPKTGKEETPGTESAPLYSLAKLDNIGQGNQDFIEKMVALFVTQMPLSVSEMKSAFLKGDFKAVSGVAHKIKPAIDSMDIFTLKDVVRDLEQTAMHDPSSDRIEGLIARVDETIALIVTSLKQK